MAVSGTRCSNHPVGPPQQTHRVALTSHTTPGTKLAKWGVYPIEEGRCLAYGAIRGKTKNATTERLKHMKAIYTLALIAAGTAFIDSAPLRASEADGRIELSSNKPDPYRPHLSYDLTKAPEKALAQVDERAGVRLQKAMGNAPAPPVKPETADQPAASYGPRMQASPAKPNNVFLSERHLGLEYSGILVQFVRDNPAQLFNPFAPAQFGDGEANTVRNVITGRAEGLKVLGFRFF
jgi:hypothetical protein